MKNSAKNRIIIWSIVSGVLIFILVAGIYAMPRITGSVTNLCRHYNNDIDITDDDYSFDYINCNKADFSIESVSSIEIYWLSGNVVVKSTDSEEISIEEYGKSTYDEPSTDMMYRLDESDGSLKIYACEKAVDLENLLTDEFYNFDSFEEEKTLIVNLPRKLHYNYIYDLSIYTFSADAEISGQSFPVMSFCSTSGNITSDNMNIPEFSAATTSGNIELTNINSNNITTDTVSGDVTLSGEIGELSVNSISGDCYAAFDNENVSDIGINTVSGKATLALPDYMGFTVNHSSVSGNFKCDFEGTSASDSFVAGDGSTSIEMDSVSGDLNIVKR